MGMLRAVIYMHVLDDASSQTVFGKHTLHNLYKQGVITGFEMLVERLLHHDFRSSDTLSAGISGVRKIFTVKPLLAGQTHFVGIDDDNIVTTFHKGAVGGFVFANGGCMPLQSKYDPGLIGSINQQPVMAALLRIWAKSFVT